MAAVGIESPLDSEGFDDSLAVTPVVELARAEVEDSEVGIKDDAALVEKVVEVGISVAVIALVRTAVGVDAL